MKLQTVPEEFGTQAVARLLSSHSQSRQPESLKLLAEVELRECAAFRIRDSDMIVQGFTHAELDFAFLPTGAPGVSDPCYPKLKLSKNEAQLAALHLSPQNPPNTPQESRISREVKLRASTTKRL